MSDLRHWIGFNRVPGIGPARLKVLIHYFGDLGRAWNAHISELRQAGLDRRSMESLVEVRERLDLDAELDNLRRAGISAISWDDPSYPSLLACIDDPPPVLYMRGSLIESDEWALAVVGTRQASAYGLEATRRLVSALASWNITIVSGLALGIDSEAHRTALDSGGRTLAVLACGLDTIYPPEHRRLAERIEQQGALLSEFPLGTPPDRRNFPPRNRVISGLARGVLVVEAGPKSGALITAGFALEQGRDVFAVPGSILTRRHTGTNRLISKGATPVLEPEDIIRELQFEMLPEKHTARHTIQAEGNEELLLSFLSDEPLHVDELVRITQWPTSTVSAMLTVMELKGLVRQTGQMHYINARVPR